MSRSVLMAARSISPAVNRSARPGSCSCTRPPRSASPTRSKSMAIRIASPSRQPARAYTANLTGPSVSVIDLAAKKVIARVAVPVQPTGLAVSRDGTTVWVASQTGGALTAIDASTNQVRGSVPIALARDVVVTPDGRAVYVSSERAVVVVDAAQVSGSG